MKVRIKTWEELRNTEGVEIYEDVIHGSDEKLDGNVFLDSMRFLCGRIVTLDTTTRSGTTHLGNVMDTKNPGWMIFDWMVVGKSEGFNDLYLKLCGE